jgi:hypothetical protein
MTGGLLQLAAYGAQDLYLTGNPQISFFIAVYRRYTNFGKKTIEQNGGKYVGSISGKTSYVLAGENMGPEKHKKAEKLGIPIISEDDFINMIK